MTASAPRLVQVGRDATIHYRGHYLYSPVSPREGALKRLAGLVLAPRTLLFVPSLGLGYGLRELLERLPAECHVLCVEADQRLMALALRSGLPLPGDPRLSILRTEEPAKAAAVLHALGPWRFRRLLAVHLCGGYQLYPEIYRRLREALEEEIRLYWQNRLTLMRMSRLWLKNLFLNLTMLPDCRHPQSLRTGRPVVVAGAGPSLETAPQWLRQIRERVVLLAVDTALPVLLDAGIRPDWIFTLDAQAHNLQDFLPWRDPGMALLCDLTASPQSLRLFPLRYPFSSRFYPLSLFERLEAAGLLPTVLPPRGSVGVAAVEAALGITSGPLLLIGLDFSYPGGKTHARGAPAQRSMHALSGRLRPPGMPVFTALLERPRLWLRDKGQGQRLLSDLVLHSYALQLQRVVGGSGRVFDLGSTGLPTGAVPVRSLGQLEEICRAPAGGARGSRAREDEAGSPPERWPPSREQVQAFLRAEAGLLREAAQELGGRSVPPEGELPVPCRQVDYLFLHLPEAEPRRLLEGHCRRQALAAAQGYLGLLERLARSMAPL
jgi:hypothetical protein